jgi:hypothetical protein
LLSLVSLLAAGCTSRPLPVTTAGIAASPQPMKMQTRTGLGVATSEAALWVNLTPDVSKLVDLVSAKAANGEALPTYSVAMTTLLPDGATAPMMAMLGSSQFGEDHTTKKPAFSKFWAPKGTVSVYLQDADGGLMGSGVKSGVPLTTGDNKVPVPVTPNKEKLALLSATDDVKVSDGTFVPGITIEVGTGFADDLPGLSRVEVELSGPGYGDGTEIASLRTFTGAGHSTFSWRPSAPSGSYDPDKLATGNEARALTMVSRAYDGFGNLVGTNKLALHVLGAATIEVGMHQ